MEQEQINKTETEIEAEDEVRETRGAKWKFVLVFFLMVVLSLGGLVGWKTYERMSGEREVKALADALEKLRQDDYDRAMADTYGGKTPQETLQMYIEAVEKGDYELASRYFIEENREKELESFDGVTEKFLKDYIVMLYSAIKNNGVYSWDKNYFSISAPIGVRMTLYPNGIWKIIEI